MQQQKKGHGGSRKIGRNKAKCLSYKLAKTRERNKSKHVFYSNGIAAYKEYCMKHGISLKMLPRREKNA